MTSCDKLLKKEFKINQRTLIKNIEKKEEDFFKSNFFTEKLNYIQMIKDLMKSIDEIGEDYSTYKQIASAGSIFESSWASEGFGAIQKDYIEKRKKLKNHVRFFI
ncbi:MAG TPA: hypothetical protein DDZ41_11635 [Flavobacterium sp.]|nr:hypothetical protein [Flavobacterium sp.]